MKSDLLQEIIKFDEEYDIRITSCGNTDTYEARRNSDGMIRLCSIAQENSSYGYPRKSYVEMIGALLCDLASGLISDIKLIEKDFY